MTEPTGSAPRPPDPTGFFTWQHPDAYFPDWAGFYRRGLARREELRRRLPHEVDLRYGPDRHHLADLYYPDQAQAAPVIVYFHGGRWREGHPAFYDQFAEPWVADGAVFVSCGYRLEPEHTIADAVDDAVAALRWIASRVGRYGGDPNRLVVAGHSAGGHLAAMATMTDWAPPLADATVVGAVCMSAPVDLRSRQVPDAERISPALLLTRAPERVLVSFGDPEPNKKSEDERYLTEQGLLFGKALEAAGLPAELVPLGRADHLATAAAFADRDSALFRAARAVVFGRA